MSGKQVIKFEFIKLYKYTVFATETTGNTYLGCVHL